MKQTGVQVGSEQHPVGECAAQCLGKHQLVVHIRADHPDGVDGTVGVVFQDFLDQPANIVRLGTALGPLDRSLRVAASPGLRRRTAEDHSIQSSQVRVALQLDVDLLARTRQAASQGLRKGPRVYRIPFTDQVTRFFPPVSQRPRPRSSATSRSLSRSSVPMVRTKNGRWGLSNPEGNSRRSCRVDPRRTCRCSRL